MTIFEIFSDAVGVGIRHDFRPRDKVFSYYWKETIKGPAGAAIENPYADTGVVHAISLETEVRRAACGIDIGQDEILAAHAWQEGTGKAIDCFIAHHPRGRLLGSFPNIVKTQMGNLEASGVSTRGLEKLYDRQFREDQENARDINLYRTENTLELLGKNYISLHTPLDNLGARHVESIIRKSGARTLGECEEALMEIPEYKIFFEYSGIRPVSHVGKSSAKLGRFLLTEFTGGEEGPKEVYARMKRAGVDTIVVMHISAAALKAARKARLNVVSAGHISSDSIGMNLFCDMLEKRGVEILPLGGFIRHRRG